MEHRLCHCKGGQCGCSRRKQVESRRTHAYSTTRIKNELAAEGRLWVFIGAALAAQHLPHHETSHRDRIARHAILIQQQPVDALLRLIHFRLHGIFTGSEIARQYEFVLIVDWQYNGI